MPPLKSRFRPDLFETRTDAWRSAGLGDEVALRINATPMRPQDGSELAEQVLDALRPGG